jgi:hypothetical protein
MLPVLYTLFNFDFDLHATHATHAHARGLLPAELASVSFGFVLVRVRVLTLSHEIAT